MDTSATVTIAMLLFLILSMVIFAYSIIMVYHWHAFGQNKRTVLTATIVYLGGLALFGGSTLLSAFSLLNQF